MREQTHCCIPMSEATYAGVLGKIMALLGDL